MKKPVSTILTLITAGVFFAAGTALGEPRLLPEPTLDTIAGESGIAAVAPLLAIAERDTEVNREILRRNTVTDYPVESTDRILSRYNTLQAGKASGQTIHELLNEATPGRLPQFFIDEAQRITTP